MPVRWPPYLPYVQPPMQWPVDPRSALQQGAPASPVPLPNSQNYGEDNDYLFGDEANPSRRNGVQGVSMFSGPDGKPFSARRVGMFGTPIDPEVYAEIVAQIQAKGLAAKAGKRDASERKKQQKGAR